MFRPDREPRGEDPLLLVKMTIFLAAAGIALVGMALQRTWIIGVAIALLALAFLLRFLRPRRNDPRAGADNGDEPSSGEPPPDAARPPRAPPA